MTPELLNLLLMAAAGVLGFFLRRQPPAPGPVPGPIPGPVPQPPSPLLPPLGPTPVGPANPLFELLRLLLERLLQPRPGAVLQFAPAFEDAAAAYSAELKEPPAPAWAHKLFEEVRALRAERQADLTGRVGLGT